MWDAPNLTELLSYRFCQTMLQCSTLFQYSFITKKMELLF